MNGVLHKKIFCSSPGIPINRFLQPGNISITPQTIFQRDYLVKAHKPTYFNSGCCCLNDGDITGIEIADGNIRLIKWYDEEIQSKRKVLEEISFSVLLKDIGIHD
jgi:hypothetical protein